MKNNSGIFKVTSIKLHFIYTFLFSSFNIEENIKNSDSEKILKKLLSLNLCQKKSDNVDIHWAGKDVLLEKKDHTYLDPYLHLVMSRIEIKGSLNKSIKLLKWSKESNQYESSFIRIFLPIRYKITILESGQGILEFEIKFDAGTNKFLNIEDITQLCNLGMRRAKFSDKDRFNQEYSSFKLQSENGEFFLFTQFFNIIKNFENVFKEYFGNNKNIWIDTDSRLNLFGNIEKHKDLQHFQDPFPIVELIIPDNIYAASFLDFEQAKMFLHKSQSLFSKLSINWLQNQTKLNSELLTLLFRSKASNFPDTSFASNFVNFSNGKLVNMCSTSLVFLHLYSRSAIAICTKNKNSEEHALYIVPAFIETVKYIRMRWHTCVVFTLWLDKIVEKFYKNRIEPIEAIKILEDVINIRKDITRGLTDPTTYRTASGSLSILHKIGIDIFRLEELRNIFLTRMQMLEKLYNDQKEKMRLSEIQLLDDKFKIFEQKVESLTK